MHSSRWPNGRLHYEPPKNGTQQAYARRLTPPIASETGSRRRRVTFHTIVAVRQHGPVVPQILCKTRARPFKVPARDGRPGRTDPRHGRSHVHVAATQLPCSGAGPLPLSHRIPRNCLATLGSIGCGAVTAVFALRRQERANHIPYVLVPILRSRGWNDVVSIVLHYLSESESV